MIQHGYWMLGSHASRYLKVLFTPEHIGVGVSLEIDHTYYQSWEFTLHLACLQVWIGA